MSTKLPEVADLEKFEELGYQQTRDRNAEKKQIMLTRSREVCTGWRACVAGEKEGE